MGAWGFADDQNDHTLDFWNDLKEEFLKKNNPKILKKDSNEKEKYIESNYLDFANFILDKIHSIFETGETYKDLYYPFGEHLHLIPGVAIMLTDLRGGKLFKNFPESLRQKAYEMTKKELEEINREFPRSYFPYNNTLEDRNKRIEALKGQLELFKKPSNKKKTKEYPFPFKSASSFEVGTIKRGQDRRLYIVKETEKGVKRWVKYQLSKGLFKVMAEKAKKKKNKQKGGENNKIYYKYMKYKIKYSILKQRLSEKL